MRALLVTVIPSVVLALAPEVRADPPAPEVTLAVERNDSYRNERRPSLVLAGSFGVLHHATTGTAPTDGYDTASAPSLGATARLLFPLHGCPCLWHGVELNYAWASGTRFGIDRDAAWTQHNMDASYAVRTELPCLRRGDRRWWVTAAAGLAVRVANAGLGDRATDDTERLNERTLNATRYDHTAMGWRVGGELSVTFGRMLVGVALDLRDLYGIDTELRRTTVMGAALRIGGDFIL
jgi:hypothetical protein